MSDETNRNTTGKDFLITRVVPFSLSAGILLIDQIVKLLIVINLPLRASINILGDFLKLTHVRNKAIAFGIGGNLPGGLKEVLFFVLPLLVIVFLVIFILRSNDLKPLQRWTLCAIVGGGLGNIMDRIIRPEGVVDFIDMDFFDITIKGIIDIKRWPTYNLADATIVVGICILVVSMIIEEIRAKKERNEK
ncbi:MAG: signal peptidase II [Spirochaetales bacterium]|nr:signal peptidase II [Spirochaetales bacterium]